MKLRQVLGLIGSTVVALFAAAQLLKRPQPVPAFASPETENGVPAVIAEVESEPDPSPDKTQHSQANLKQPRQPKAAPRVAHEPQQPRSGQTVLVTADFKGRSMPTAELTLDYQVVDPGKYIALNDSAFKRSWVSLPMNDRGQAGDRNAGDGIFTTELPSNLQRNRRLVRYRLRAGGDPKIIAPDESDAQVNYAFFVYDGVPPWKGAINPSAREVGLKQPVTYSSAALQRVPVYHLISSKPSVEKATWLEQNQFGGRNRNEYHYTGTMVYDGVVYDHIGFRARGGSWRHAMGKNMWKFNFLPGHRFQARDDYGRPYEVKWDKLNLGACIQQGDYGMRGEQGMFEAIGFRLFNLAGMEASRTHWVHFRIIDQAEESPANQYAGDFWGLYLAVENVDAHFLKEHELPAGNLYKMEFRAKTAFNGNPAITRQEDVNEFSRALSRRPQEQDWWANNVDLPRYFNYRAILECIHHYDIEGGKNYFYYHNPQSMKWVVIPWDIDLTWGDHMFGGGHEPFYRAGVLSRPGLKQQYQQRLAEIRDLLFNPDEMNKLIDEHAAMIRDPKAGPSLVDADRAKWDYNPILASPYAMGMKAGQGKFYFGDPHNTFEAMVKYMKGYAAQRANWVDSRLLRGYQPPKAPNILALPKIDLSAPSVSFQLQPAGESSPKTTRWRLAEITETNSPSFNPRQPWSYEIQAVWEQEVKNSGPALVPTKFLQPGHVYRVRACCQDAEGSWSRWSSPAQVTVPNR